MISNYCLWNLRVRFCMVVALGVSRSMTILSPVSAADAPPTESWRAIDARNQRAYSARLGELTPEQAAGTREGR